MIKVLKFRNDNSLKTLKSYLDKRKAIQRNQTTIVSKIIQNVKKNGDKAVLSYEKRYSKIKTKSKKILFSKKEIYEIANRTDFKIKKSIDLAFGRIKRFHLKQNFHHLLLRTNIKIYFHINILLLKK